MLDIKTIRARAAHYLSPDIAASVGLSLAQLQQFLAGTQRPSDEQLSRLAARMGVLHRDR